MPTSACLTVTERDKVTIYTLVPQSDIRTGLALALALFYGVEKFPGDMHVYVIQADHSRPGRYNDLSSLIDHFTGIRPVVTRAGMTFDEMVARLMKTQRNVRRRA